VDYNSSKDKWIAHVTLGNLRGGTEYERKNLDHSVLKPLYDAAMLSQQPHSQAKTVGIAMGGPIPEQVELDWNFQPRPNRKP
jgi:hypothetical protein